MVGQTTSAGHSLSNEAEGLEEMVARFKVDGAARTEADTAHLRLASG